MIISFIFDSHNGHNPTDSMASLSLDEAAQLYGTLHHFFEVAVHDILFYRHLYPERAFAAATAFDIPVHQSRHPAVCAWVRAAVEQVIVQIAGGESSSGASGRPGSKEGLPVDNVNAVALAVHAPFEATSAGSAQAHSLPPGAVLERWVFDVRHLPRGWPGGIEALRRAQKDVEKRGKQGEERGRERRQRRRRRRSPNKGDVAEGGGTEEGQDGPEGERYNYYDEEEELANAESEAELDKSPFASDDEDDADEAQGADSSNMNWKDLNDQLRGVLQRLAQAGQQVAALPDGCTFTMAIELGGGDKTEGEATTRNMDTNWIPETSSRKRKFGGGRAGGAGASTTSIRSVDSSPLFLECWVEESAVKKAAAEGASSAKLAITAKNAKDVLPPPPTASASTVTSYGMDTSFNFDQIMAQDSLLKGENSPQKSKGKAVSFS